MIRFEEVENSEIKISELALLSSEIWHEYWTCILSEEQIDYMVDKFQSKHAILDQINNENYVYLYILYNNIKAGYIGMSIKNDEIFLSKLYIKKDFRHKGIGTESFGFIKNFAKNKNLKKIVLTVNKYNKNTIDAYIKWGFIKTNSVVTDIGSGFVMDDYIMEYNFSD